MSRTMVYVDDDGVLGLGSASQPPREGMTLMGPVPSATEIQDCAQEQIAEPVVEPAC